MQHPEKEVGTYLSKKFTIKENRKWGGNVGVNELQRKRASRDCLNTFSIVGHDPENGEWGVAVASKFLAAGAVVPFAKAGAGAIATQSWANTEYGTRGLELLASGLSAEQVLQKLIEEDPDRAVRQVGIVDAQGNGATFTGDECHSWAGGVTGPHFACQGNILVDEKTVQAMAESFQNEKGTLAERLLSALLAGDRAGGDSRGKQSAALLVVKEGAGYGGFSDKYIDLRVDDHVDPVVELMRLHRLHTLYFRKPDPQDILQIDQELKQKLTDYLIQLGYLSKDGHAKVTDEDFHEALKNYQLIENFDERILEPGQIDRQVLEFMEEQIK